MQPHRSLQGGKQRISVMPQHSHILSELREGRTQLLLSHHLCTQDQRHRAHTMYVQSVKGHLRRGAERSGQGPAAGAAALLVGGRGFLQLLGRVLQKRWQLLLACTRLPWSGRTGQLGEVLLQERHLRSNRVWLYAECLLPPVSQQLPAICKTPDAPLSLMHTARKAHATMEGSANPLAGACQHTGWICLCMCKRPCLARRASPAQRPSA